MIKQPNMKMIGVFVSVSIICFVLMLGYFLKSRFSDNETEVVMFFDESVKGLDTGAPVLFKGVKVGEVSQIKLQADLQTMKFLILVYAKIYNGKSLITNTTDERERLNMFIDNGLRAQLAINSVITGQLLIELDMFPHTKPVLHQISKSKYEIPTIVSPFAEISNTIKMVPIAQISQDVHGITETLNKNLPPLLTQMNTTLETIDSILTENKNNTARMVTTVGSAAQSFNLLVNENAENISSMIESFGSAAQSLKNLTDYLQMYPSSIFTGKEY